MFVEGDELYFDATKVEADAAMSSLRPRLSLEATREHVRMVFEEDTLLLGAPQILAWLCAYCRYEAHSRPERPRPEKPFGNNPKP